jgi:hypothetical protein
MLASSTFLFESDLMIDEALSRGEISYAKARALTRVATPVNETRLCELAMAATGAQLERICRRFRRATGELAGVPGADGEDERAVRVRPTASGMLRIEVTLDPDEADLVLLAIDKVRETLSGGAAAPVSVTEATRDVSAETRPVPSRADAVVLLAEQALSGEGSTNESGAVASGGGRHQVFIHLDRSLVGPAGEWDVFLDDGTRLSPEAFRRVSCDAALVGAVEGAGGAVLDIGRRSRVIPPAIRRALWLRDRGCRFPGCANRRFVHGHHIRHWAHGGETSLENLVMLCGFHHRLVHEGGFAVIPGATGEPAFLDQRGGVLDDAPRAVGSVADGDLAEMASLRPDTDTSLCRWDGDLVDYDWAVDALIAAGGP